MNPFLGDLQEIKKEDSYISNHENAYFYWKLFN